MSDLFDTDDSNAAEAASAHLSFSMPLASWRRLFAAVAEGSHAALGDLYEAASQRVYGLALWRTGCPEDASEVLQEVFVRLAEKRRQLAELRDPRAWLLTIAHRAAVDILRRRTRRAAAPLDTCTLLEAPADDPSRQVDGDRVSRMLSRLPAAQRDVIYLKHFADCSFSEAARITGVPTFTAASRYRLGIRKLRRLVDGGV